MRFKSLLLIGLLLLATIGCHGNRQLPAANIHPDLPLHEILQNTLDAARSEYKVMGASACVFVRDKKVWAGVSGMSDPTIKKRITPEMLFDIGSAGKNFIAALAVQLSSEGRLSLDDPINKWLKTYQNIDGKITVRQLLNHTSGVFDFVKHPRSPWQMAYRSTRTWTQEEILNELVSDPYFPPGQGWRYATTNYTLLRMILEKVLQTSVCSEINQRYFVPLGFKHAICVDPLKTLPQGVVIADNWIFRKNVDLAPKPQPWTTTSPHLVYTNAEDLAQWFHTLFYKKTVLNEQSLGQMMSFYSPTPGDPPLSGYGLGLAYLDAEQAGKNFGVSGYRMYGHGGKTLGNRAIVMHIPEMETTLSLLINDDTDDGLTGIFRALLECCAADDEN